AEGDLRAESRRPRGAPLLPDVAPGAEPPRRRPPVVHDDVRPRQHLHEPPGASVHSGSRRNDPPRARAAAGHAGRRLPRGGARTGSGSISYQRKMETGLENQCWKDSWDSIAFRNGELPGFPRATCELQGYAYDAKTRGARLARTVWKDDEYADRLERQAADL